MWIRPQRWTGTENHLVTRVFENDKFGSGGNVPLQLWVDSEGKMNLGLQNWGGQYEIVASEPLIWNARTWYQVALIFCGESQGSSVFYNFKVYVTARGAERISEPVVDATGKPLITISGVNLAWKPRM